LIDEKEEGKVPRKNGGPMPKKESIVQLTDEERAALIALTKQGTIAARKLARAHMLRLADEGKQDAEIVVALGHLTQ
jgi:hypothetical protein